jgi:FKBP-type peptidyl-prolyl cis-trans isomerase (trigger factor)
MDTVTRNENGNLALKITIPWEKIKQGYEKIVLKAVSEAEISGFRKGKAPRHMVEPKLDSPHTYSEAVQSLLPEAYAACVKEHNIKAILYPRISIDKAEMQKDWEFTATTCETPLITLDNYRDTIKSVKKDPKENLLSRIIETLQKSLRAKIPDLLVEEEANHRLSELVENITRMGLTTQSYLQSKKITSEDLKAQISVQARKDLEIEFMIEHIRTQEKLPERAKTIDFLLNLV